jgi:hypothetical protein
VVGTGRYTTSTTNMYNTSRTSPVPAPCTPSTRRAVSCAQWCFSTHPRVRVVLVLYDGGFGCCCFCRGSCHSCSHSTRIQSRCGGCRGQTCVRNQCRNRRRRRSCCVPCNPPLQTGRVGSGKLYLKISKIEKRLVLIILVIVFKHTIKI